MKSPILGSSYVARSINAANNRMINLFPESIQEGGKEYGFLNRCPGTTILATIGDGPIRGQIEFGGFGYVVSGDTLYKIDTLWAGTAIGTVSGTGVVSMADNGIQLFIAANPDGFIYNSKTEEFGIISDTDFPGASTVGFLDGYFVFTEPESPRIWVTSLFDGTTIDPLDFASAEGSPDNIVAMAIDHREVWLFGTDSVEVFYNAGTADSPLSRIQGAFIEVGCAARGSVAKVDNSLFWIGIDKRGQGIVYRASGYSAARVSTHSIEHIISGLQNLSEAVAFSYQQEGHSFYFITFPGCGISIVYDASTNAWHERAEFTGGVFRNHRASSQMFFNSKTVVGDFENGNIYSLDLGTYSDAGNEQKWLRTWRALLPAQNQLKKTSHHSLQIDCESGVGLNNGQGSDPVVFLRWSDDGGHTWSNIREGKIGKIGETGRRVIFRRLGNTKKLRDRVYELSGTDPVKIAITGAEIVMSQART